MSSVSRSSSSQVQDTAHQLADQVSGAISKTLHLGADKTGAAVDTVSSAAKQMADQAAVCRDKVTHFIEHRPLTAVIIALGVGAIAAKCLARR